MYLQMMHSLALDTNLSSLLGQSLYRQRIKEHHANSRGKEFIQRFNVPESKQGTINTH